MSLVETRGMILDKKVNMQFLVSMEPKHFSDYIKFVVNLKTRQVGIGMAIHSASFVIGEKEDLRGGNIFFDDGHIEYESGINVEPNLKSKKFIGNPRFISDKDTINEINTIITSKIEGLIV